MAGAMAARCLSGRGAPSSDAAHPAHQRSFRPVAAFPQSSPWAPLQLPSRCSSLLRSRPHQSLQQPRQRSAWHHATANVDASTLFDELTALHCVPPTHVALARVPEGLGWVLPRNTSREPAACRSSGLQGTAAPGAADTAGGAGSAPQAQQQQQKVQQQLIDDQSAAEPQQTTILIRVPLRLCLSHEVPGCCPGACSSRALAPMLACADQTAVPWEVVLAALLVWACRLPEAGPGTAGGGAGPDPGLARFWRRYRALLPTAVQQTSLTFWNRDELQQLQNDSLASEAAAWQATLLAAYRRFIDTPEFQEELGPGAVTLRDWLEAVGAVESRAFGFTSDADGRELHAYVPFFCLANYRPGALTLHVLRLQQPDPPAAGEADVGQRPDVADSDAAVGAPAGAGAPGSAWQPTADMVALELPHAADAASLAASPAQDGSRGCAGHPQIYIDYGKKDSRSLVLQYGFVIHGNPYDRLDWEGCGLGPSDRMRREWVYNAAEMLARRLEALAQAGAAPAGEAGEGAIRSRDSRGCDAGAAVKDADAVRSGEAALEQAQLLGPGGVAAARVRLRSAAASIVAACGWRNMRERRLVTNATEARAVHALASWASARLEGMPTLLESDLQLLAELGATGSAAPGDDGAMGGQPTARQDYGRVSYTSDGGQHSRAQGAGDGAMTGCSEQEEFEAAVGDVPARTVVALCYRVERKLLLGAALLLLGSLTARAPVAHVT